MLESRAKGFVLRKRAEIEANGWTLCHRKSLDAWRGGVRVRSGTDPPV